MRCVSDDCRQVCDSGQCKMKCRTTNDCEQSCLPFFSACPLLDCYSKQKSCRQVSEVQEVACFVTDHVGQLKFCFKSAYLFPMWRRGGLMVSALVSGSSGRVLAEDIVLCPWARHFTLSVPLFTQGCKWVPASLMLRWTSIPSRGGVQILLAASCYRNISAGLMGHLFIPYSSGTCFCAFSSSTFLP